VRAVPGEVEWCGTTGTHQARDSRRSNGGRRIGRPESIVSDRIVGRVPESGRSDWGSGVGGSARRGQEVVGSEKSCLSAEGEG
jgi:hypothetical protein